MQMIKLNRLERPKALTDEVCQELTRLYIQNKNKDVWNSPMVKQPLKEALLELSHSKCAYCECSVNIESKDITIDHFLPKSMYADKVVEWKNLLPACLRCNRKKNACEEILINPCENEPKEFLGLAKQNPFRLKGIDRGGIGKNTILKIGLNDLEKVMVARMTQWEDIHQRLEDIQEDIQEHGYHEKYRRRLETLMDKCTVKNPYSAVKASNMLVDECYIKIKEIIKESGAWSASMAELENEIEQITLQLV